MSHSRVFRVSNEAEHPFLPPPRLVAGVPPAEPA